MHNPAIISISASLVGLLAILGILGLVFAFSCKRALMAIVMLAGLGVAVAFVGALFLSYSGMRRGGPLSHQFADHDSSSSSLMDSLPDIGPLDSLPESATILLGRDPSDHLTIEVCTAESADDTDDVDDATSAEIDEFDQDDIWSEDPEIDNVMTVMSQDTGERETESNSQTSLESTEDDQPSWVFEDLQVLDEPHRVTVSVGPYPTWKEVNRHTDDALLEGLRQYADWSLSSIGQEVSLGMRAADLYVAPSRLRECVVETFDYIHESPSPTMNEMPMRYILMEFDKDFRRKVLEPSWRRSESISRSKSAGAMAGGVLAMLATTLGLLKLDSATHGKRRKTLVTTAGLVASAIGAMALLVLRA